MGFATENNDICRERGGKNEKLKKNGFVEVVNKNQTEKKSQLIDILIFLGKKSQTLNIFGISLS